MYLKELEIFGFKSFPQKTALKFESGITVVVGPNGCGKSNIFDAIKWSLGEQSPKSLRGARMEDVIFNGTENYPPLNYAEVSLTFSNEDRYLPIDYKEVSVARRLYRSGESQYFINKNIVRLKDVQELFMGTGIGEATYSFVEQGKIETFLSYKPEDKRLIFDEASGIVKYKERKREALRRLDETEDNLLRLDDIMLEVKRQIRYLERQVEKAKKYKEAESSLIETERNIAALQFGDLEAKISKLFDELNAFKDKEKNKDTELKEANSQWDELNAQFRALRASIEEAATKVVSAKAETDSATTQIAIAKQRIKEIEDRSKTREMTKFNLNQRLELQEKRNQEEARHLNSLDESVKGLKVKLSSLSQEKINCEKEIEEAKQKSKDQKVKILDLESKKVFFHNTLIEIQAKLTTLVNRKKRLLLDKAKLETMLLENQERLRIAQEEFSTIDSRLKTLEDKKDNLANRERELGASSEECKQRLVDKEKELLELNASYEFLKDLRIKYETFSVKKKITVIFDEEPKDINKLVASLQDVKFREEGGVYKAQIEVKVVSFEEGQLEEKIESVKSEIEAISSKISDLASQKEVIRKDIDFEFSQIEELKGKLQEKLQEKDSSSREVERLKEEQELLQEEEKTTLEDISDCQEKQKLTEQDLANYQENLDSANELLISAQDTMDSGQDRLKGIDIETIRIQTTEQSLHKEKETLNSKLGLLQDEITNIQNNLEQVDKEKEEDEAKTVAFNTQIEELTKKIEEDKIKIGDNIKAKESLEQEELTLTQGIGQTKDVTHGLDKEIQELRNSIYNKKLEIQSLEYEKDKIKDYLRQVYEIDFDFTTQGEISQSLSSFLVEREKLQKRMKSLGEVNLIAIEEFEELKKREEFFDTQKQDLINSKEELKKAIQKINRISKELFMEVFTKIEVEFKKNFKFLFNGGRANLVLIDKDNILESGVEIEVQPPGKKLQNVSLLSGGEKALTAISLIFAIFKVRPSPLCVLDEIDAPLDEVNVDRFNQVLKQFSSASQFILITHNKKSMSNADVLYGVTMQEKGISKVVSVKFAAEEVAS